MKPADLKALTQYVRRVANELGLKDWKFDIKIAEDRPKNDAVIGEDDDGWMSMAVVTPIPGQRRATINFDPTFRDEPRDIQREVVVHELIHCHFADMYEHGRKGVLDLVHQTVYDAWMHGFALSWEHAIDAIACAFAPKMPMLVWSVDPPLPKEQSKIAKGRRAMPS